MINFVIPLQCLRTYIQLSTFDESNISNYDADFQINEAAMMQSVKTPVFAISDQGAWPKFSQESN